jgi:hypothetical protein
VCDLKRKSERHEINRKNTDLFLIVDILTLHSFVKIFCFRSVCVLTTLRTGNPRNLGLIPGRGKIFFSSPSHPNQESTQPAIKWVAGTIPLGVKRQGVKPTIHHHLAPR